MLGNEACPLTHHANRDIAFHIENKIEYQILLYVIGINVGLGIPFNSSFAAPNSKLPFASVFGVISSTLHVPTFQV